MQVLKQTLSLDDIVEELMLNEDLDEELRVNGTVVGR
jgi:hypothetical protein